MHIRPTSPSRPAAPVPTSPPLLPVATPPSATPPAQAPIQSGAGVLPSLRSAGQRAPGAQSPLNTQLQAMQSTTERAQGVGTPQDVRPPSSGKAGGPGNDLVADPALHARDVRADGTNAFEKTRFTGPVVVDGVSFEDIQQGSLADCYFCAATAAVAYKNPQLLQNAVRDNGDGTYSVRMHGYNSYGQMQATDVKVDGDLYTRSSGGAPAYGKSAGDKSPEKMELWFPLVEKAYAQWHGSYDKIGNGGWPKDVMQALTGNPGQQFSTAQYNADAMFQWAQQLETSRTIAVAFTHGKEKADLYTNSGVYPSHAYTVLGAQEENGVKYVRVRNPWGRGEPSGDGKDDGIFRLKLDDFCKLFPWVDIGVA